MSVPGSPSRELMHRATLAATVGVVVVGAVAAQMLVLSPLKKVNGEIETAQGAVSALERQLEDSERVAKTLRERGAATLGATVDEASHQFRTRLSALAEARHMSRIVVDQKSGESTLNPLAGARGVPQSLMSVRTKLRKEPDFTLIRGSLKAQGTLEHSLGLMAAVQSQAWVHRVEGFSIRPVGRERQQVELTLDVSALFVPDLVPRDYVQPAIDPVVAGRDAFVMRVASRDPFRYAAKAEPASVVAVVPPPPTPEEPGPPPAATPPAYHEWRIVGVMMGSTGGEAIVVNTRTGESRTVIVGESVLNAKLVECRDDGAIFEIDHGRFVVLSGGTLADRRAVESVHSSG